MSAQPFNGVRLGGAGGQFTIINESDKPIIGYVFQPITDSGDDPVVSVLDFHRLAVGKAIQSGEEHPLARFNVTRVAGQPKSTTIGYELRAVLFADGEFYGPDDIFQDFSGKMSTVRSLALGVLHDQNRYQTLARHVLSHEEILRGLRTATLHMRSVQLNSPVASTILDIRSKQGEEAAEAALARLAALPEITRGPRRNES